MEENLNTTALGEETAPQGTEEQSATEEMSVDTEQSTTSEQGEAGQTDLGAQANGESDGQASGENTDDVFTVKFNHETKSLTLSEARAYAQKGMQSESIMSDLRYLAARSGEESVSALIKKLIEASELSRRAELSGQINSDDESLIESLMSADIAGHKKAAGAMLESEQKAYADDEKSENERLAAEFIALNTEFPELKEFKDIPADVLRNAAKDKISLLDSYLRFKHAEIKKINKAEQSQTAAKGASAGSLGSEETDNSTPALEAMRKGVWR